MSKQLILHIGAGTLSMETKGYQGNGCLHAHETYKNLFGHEDAEQVSVTPTEEMNVSQDAPQVSVQG